jgi:hypothetical protein
VNTLGRMAESTKANINLIRNMDLELILGRMEGSILGNGGIVRDTEMERLFRLMVVRGKGFGRMMLRLMTIRLGVVILSPIIAKFHDI